MKQANEESFLSEDEVSKQETGYYKSGMKHRKSYKSQAYNPSKQLSSPLLKDEKYPLSQVKKNDQSNLQKEIKDLREKIKEQQFLIQLQTAVHKQLMTLLSKKKVSLMQNKSQKSNIDRIFQVYQHTQDYLDKAQIYVKNMKKLQSFTS